MTPNHPFLLNSKIKGRYFQAVVNLGLMENFISEKVVKKLDIKTDELTFKSEVELAYKYA